ncbi:MAG: EAL domain-containing protein [Methylobacter sp.]|nr:EAL domain-containing protein [Methylobacter sp.]MDP2426516.1 EAL domain-containing protein [Methylobacter sp.]MDP3056217.1 EAL domain-containing protein [Methylobacter sp.]MDP3361487.1 EAL domain-containing protein [Methylobacter sp.]MDZ4221220.1 EAL domain-containing protein [Methylobacter sp.]
MKNKPETLIAESNGGQCQPAAAQDIEIRYRALFDNMFEGVAYCSMVFEGGKPSDFICLDVNLAFETLTGLRDVIGKKVSTLIPDFSSSNRALFDSFGRVAATGATERFETYIDRLNSWFIVTVYGAGNSRFIAVFADTTEKKLNEQALQTSERKCRSLFDEARQFIGLLTSDGIMVDINRTALELAGIQAYDVSGKPFWETPWWTPSPEVHELLQSAVARAAQGDYVRFEVKLQASNGNLRDMDFSLKPLSGESGIVEQLIAEGHDITEHRNYERQLEHMATHDILTGLANRSLLADRISQAISHACRFGQIIAVFLLDIDRFKLINDSLGHGLGDLLLKEIAHRLKSCTRVGDTVARMGGDEFVLLMTNLENENDSALFGRRVLDALSFPIPLDGHQLTVTASAGVSLYPKDGNDLDVLLKNADIALCRAKDMGRNCFQFYSSRMNERMLQRLEFESELRLALKHGWFTLHYQPQVDILSGEIIGCEALIRMNHPERGMIPPNEFISMAEETGLIVAIGEWVIQEACQQMKRWQDEHPNELVMAVNVSPLQFRHPDLIEVVRRALESSGLAASYLELEFTEGALMKNVPSTLQLMKKFKAMGLRLAIDDFGTGYSSLNYLKQFPIDKLKIDQSFVKNIAFDPSDAAIVQAIIALARSLGLSTIAEGVETEAQLGYLRVLHCNELQGFFFSRAVPPDEFIALLERSLHVKPIESEHVLLLVDDEKNILASLNRILCREGYQILMATSGEEGLELMAKHRVDVVISDQRMTGMSGVEFLRRVKLMYPNAVRMILSGYTEIDTLTDAINKGEIYQFINKPWDNNALLATIREAFSRHDLFNKNTDDPGKNSL